MAGVDMEGDIRGNVAVLGASMPQETKTKAKN